VKRAVVRLEMFPARVLEELLGAETSRLTVGRVCSSVVLGK
jgi:hypothetical protein